MSQIQNCITKMLIKALSGSLGKSERDLEVAFSSGKLKLARPPDPGLGDYGIALHPLLKEIDPSEWQLVGEKIVSSFLSYAKECRVLAAGFQHGYLNMRVDYTGLFMDLVAGISSGRFFSTLSSIGNGRKVIVEHTSANPVHPLHIGSGRNSVLGDTYARLLEKLGFTVDRRFYVNDMGRQVAILLYGYQKVMECGIKPSKKHKVDHWMGAIYALTNIIAEIDKLTHEIEANKVNMFNNLREVLDTCVSSINQQISQLCSSTKKILDKTSYVTDPALLFTDVTGHLEKLKELGTSNPLHSSLVSKVGETLDQLKKLNEQLSELKEFHEALARMAAQFPEIHRCLRNKISSYQDFEKEVSDIMLKAESGDPATRELLRQVSSLMIGGFEETLSNINVFFDGFDYESSDEILELANDVVNKMLKTPYVRIVDGAVEVDLNKAAEDIGYVRDLFHPDEAGRFIIRRSNGTTLYVTRDIAYTIYKFDKLGAEKVYNVIAVEQSRAQKQLKAVLYILGFKEHAMNLVHFSYEMVHLKHMRMSGRRGIYYTMDELLVDMVRAISAKYSADKKMDALSPEVAYKLAVNNLRSLLLSVEPSKVLVVDPSLIKEFDHGVSVTYAYVRAQGVIKRLLGVEHQIEKDKATRYLLELADTLNRCERIELSVEEKMLAEYVYGLSKTLVEAYEEMKPNKILEYAILLTGIFNKWYEKYPVVGEKDPLKKAIRSALVIMVFLVLDTLFDVLGFHKVARL